MVLTTARDCKGLSLLNYEWFSHYCSCPTVPDWIAVYSALFFNMTQLIYFALFWFKVGPLRVLKGGPMGVCSQKYILQM